MPKKNVLVVDDIEIVFNAFKEELDRSAYLIDTALSGETALEKARTKNYDIIFIDLFMPGMSGVQTCRALKEISPDSNLIAMTGQIYDGLIYKELEFVNAGGQIHYLYKPFLKGDILKITQNIFDKIQ